MPVLFFSLNQRYQTYWQQVSQPKNLFQPWIHFSAVGWGMGSRAGDLRGSWPVPPGLPSPAVPLVFLTTRLLLGWNACSLSFACSRIVSHHAGTGVVQTTWRFCHLTADASHKCHLLFDNKECGSRAQHSVFASKMFFASEVSLFLLEKKDIYFFCFTAVA